MFEYQLCMSPSKYHDIILLAILLKIHTIGFAGIKRSIKDKGRITPYEVFQTRDETDDNINHGPLVRTPTISIGFSGLTFRG